MFSGSLKYFSDFENNLKLNIMLSLTASLGSLYFSQVMRFIPCELCLYQRIFMFSLVIIFVSAYKFKDKKFYIYAFPLALIGLAVAFYHNLLQYGLLPESLTTCTVGIPCDIDYLNLFGFVTIPLLSFIVYLSIGAALFVYRKNVS